MFPPASLTLLSPPAGTPHRPLTLSTSTLHTCLLGELAVLLLDLILVAPRRPLCILDQPLQPLGLSQKALMVEGGGGRRGGQKDLSRSVDVALMVEGGRRGAAGSE